MADKTTDTRLVALADSWQAEAAKRRKLSAHDVGADILAYCAEELRSELLDTAGDDAEVSAAEYAEMHNISPNTVRRWCQLGALPARPVGREWRIRRGEPTPKLRRLA